MNWRPVARLFLCAGLLLQPAGSTTAFETDQYNLPPRPLADIGDEVSQYVQDKLRLAINRVNGEITLHQRCLAKHSATKEGRCGSPEVEQARLAYLRSNDAVAHEVYDKLGTGFPPTTRSGTWIDTHHFAGEPARFKTSYWNSIFLVWPTDYFTISPTVNLYGSQFGTDKIAHLFQQGYTYYKIARRAQGKGATLGEGAQKAVRWGQFTERTIYGTLISGVYSNADLCANYIGMKFYLGLTQPIRIGGGVRPAILVLRDGEWVVNDEINLAEVLLKPLISSHLNEALNPSIFTQALGLRWYVRKVVREKSCRQWLAREPNLNQAALNQLSHDLIQWRSEDYGFTASEHFVTIANTCFGGVQDNRQ